VKVRPHSGQANDSAVEADPLACADDFDAAFRALATSVFLLVDCNDDIVTDAS